MFLKTLIFSASLTIHRAWA